MGIIEHMSNTCQTSLPLTFLKITAGLVAAATIFSADLSAADNHMKKKELNVYSYRQEFLIRPLLDRFTRQSGIHVNVVYAKTGMLERLRAEGRNSPADVILTVDISRLEALKKAQLLKPIRSRVIEEAIPSQYRDPDGLWFGLTTRARVVAVSRNRMPEGRIKRYEDLADPRFKGRICSRKGSHVYNVGLVASLVAHLGAEPTESWARGVVANLARKPQGNDRAQVKAIKEGICDIAIVNSYYFGKMANNDEQPEQKEWAKSARVIFPNQADRGTHVNISGAAVARYAPHADEAVTLIAFLSSEDSQRMYATVNHEYPVRPGITSSKTVQSWGDFKADKLPIVEVASHAETAQRIIDRVGW